MSIKALLAKFAFRHAIGVYVGDREVVVSKLAGTWLGPVEVAQTREAYTPDQLGSVLTRLLTPLKGRWKRFPIPVALGLAGQRVFFSTRQMKSATASLTPQMLLHEVLQSASISVDDMSLDMIKTRADKRHAASVVSCRRKYLIGLLAALRTAGVNPIRAEPGPCALLRQAVLERKAPRRANVVLRLFLGAEQGLAILAVGNNPFVWRYFSMGAGKESNSLLSAIRTIQTLAKPSGIHTPIDVVMAHGRPDLRELLESDAWREAVGMRTVWAPGPALEDSRMATGLALGCLSENTTAFDLARNLKPRRSLWELFPWGETLLQGAFIICMALFLADRSGTLDRTYAAVKKKITDHKWLQSATESDLLKEKKDLEKRVQAIKRFLESRVIWTAYARDIPTRLPANATMIGFEGQCDLEVQGKKKDAGLKSKKQLILRLSSVVPESGSLPTEIDEVVDVLSVHPLLKRDFPDVEVAHITRNQSMAGKKPTTDYTVICLPKKSAPAPKSDSEHAE